MTYKSKYGLGELVYLVTDEEQKRRMITGVKFNLNGIVYTLQHGTNESYHYEPEISRDEDILQRLDVFNQD